MQDELSKLFEIVALGIKILRTPVIVSMYAFVNVLKASIVLHNFFDVRKTFDHPANRYWPAGSVDAQTGDGFEGGGWKLATRW